MDDQNRNLILAIALSILVILGWSVMFPPELPEEGVQPVAEGQSTTPGIAPTPQTAEPGSTEVATTATPSTAQAPRIDIETDEVEGSISLLGGRIDDLRLRQYRETLEPDSDIVTLLSPVGSDNAYYALYGWAPGGDLALEDVPGAETLWEATTSGALTTESPLTLEWDNGKGLVFERTISIDEHFMFSVAQSVRNTSDAPARLAPYGLIARHGEPETIGFFVLHEGVVRLVDDAREEIDYSDMPELDFVEREGARASVAEVTENGWVGFTDKNWMMTLIPEPGQAFTSVVKYVDNAQIYLSEARLPPVTVEPGATVTYDTQLFAGAKEWQTIRDYEAGYDTSGLGSSFLYGIGLGQDSETGVVEFLDSIDWGWFFFLTKPIFWLLHELNVIIGNMGWSIIVLTLVIKAILLPLAFKSYVSMAKMKELQPEMEKIKEKSGDDRQKLQQEMMALYKKEKVNPASGCLPILVQIPIFFSLYKVIFVTLELRHAPWIGWIKDLSAPDPSSILNLFGLLPFAAPDPNSLIAIISLGILPIILGISMWLQQKLNPSPTDPTQAMIFAWMPWVFMFMLGTFASGLVLYWIANNMITFSQQYLIMRSQGFKPDVFGNILSSFKKKPAEDKPAEKK